MKKSATRNMQSGFKLLIVNARSIKHERVEGLNA